MTELLMGFMIAAWIFTVGHLVLTWRAEKASLKAILAKLDEEILTRTNQCQELRAEIGLRKTNFMTNEQVAAMERELRMKTLRNAVEGNGWQ